MAPAAPALPYPASLRVYEPVAAFPEPERSAWARYVAGGAPTRETATAAEVRQAAYSVLGTPPRAVPARESREAYVLRTADGPCVCPWQTRLRSWQALDEFRAELPGELVDLFLPRVVVEDATEQHRRWRARHPDERAHIRTCRWYVPIEWFTAVADEHRRLELANPRSLVYRTPMGEARRRIARALRTLRRTVGADPVTGSVEDIGRWLEEFHPRSVVELDYGGLVHLLDDDELRADRSAADVAAALAALAAGDEAAATAAYRRLVDRWRRVQALEHAN